MSTISVGLTNVKHTHIACIHNSVHKDVIVGRRGSGNLRLAISNVNILVARDLMSKPAIRCGCEPDYLTDRILVT